MADNTPIEWADATVNAINGCSLASPGCTNCYAMKQAHRVEIRRGLTQPSKGGMVWTGEVRFAEDQLLKPLAWKRPRRIFWNAHGDGLLARLAALGLAEVLAVRGEPREIDRPAARRLQRIDLPDVVADVDGAGVVHLVHPDRFFIVVDGDIDRTAQRRLDPGRCPAAAGEVVDDEPHHAGTPLCSTPSRRRPAAFLPTLFIMLSFSPWKPCPPARFSQRLRSQSPGFGTLFHSGSSRSRS